MAVTALEQLCNELEASVRARDWTRMGAAIADSRRTMHAFENAMADTTSIRSVEFDRSVYARLQNIYRVRDEQMQRVQAIHDDIGENLRALSRWKGYARSVGGSDRTRPPRILNDLR